MALAQPPEMVQPGIDTNAANKNMQAKLASTLNDLYKVDDPNQLQPVSQQSPVTPELSNVMSKPDTESEFDDTVAGWKGRPRTAPSKGFLHMMLDKLKKKSPDKDIEAV